jgi:hypothetical protein
MVLILGFVAFMAFGAGDPAFLAFFYCTHIPWRAGDPAFLAFHCHCTHIPWLSE